MTKTNLARLMEEANRKAPRLIPGGQRVGQEAIDYVCRECSSAARQILKSYNGSSAQAAAGILMGTQAALEREKRTSLWVEIGGDSFPPSITYDEMDLCARLGAEGSPALPYVVGRMQETILNPDGMKRLVNQGLKAHEKANSGGTPLLEQTAGKYRG